MKVLGGTKYVQFTNKSQEQLNIEYLVINVIRLRFSYSFISPTMRHLQK